MPNTSYIRVTYNVQTEVALKTFKGFILIFHQANINAQSGVTAARYFTISSKTNYYLTGNYPVWGPSFSFKCFTELYSISYLTKQGSRNQLLHNAYGNYITVTQNDASSINHIFFYNFFCIGKGLTACGQNHNFYDIGTNTCYIGSSCPLSTVDPGLPRNSYQCRFCISLECLNCTGNASYCWICDVTLHAVAVNESCVCETDYLKANASSPCQHNCTLDIPGCQPLGCFLASCTTCLPGYYRSLLFMVYICVQCNSSMSGCTSCREEVQIQMLKM